MQTVVVARPGYICWKNSKQYNERINGPSIIDDSGYQVWTNSCGFAHREDGPAVSFGNVRSLYYLNGTCYSKSDFDQTLKDLQCKL